MADAKTIQVATDGVVTNVILVPEDATMIRGGGRVTWGEDESLSAPDGSRFYDQDGAGIGWTVSGSKLVAPAAPPDPDPVVVPVYTYKVDLFRRATEDEAEQIDAALAAASARMRRLFDGAQRLDHDAEEFLTLQAAAIQLFGQTRADALLAPSA